MEHGDAVDGLSALAHGVRLALFRRLVRAGPDGLCPGDLQEALGLTPSALSFHLKTLRQAGLVGVRQAGRHLFYSADFDAMNTLLQYLTENCCAESGHDCALPPQCATS